MSEKKQILVAWNGPLQISKGDEIEITRAIVDERKNKVTAFRIRNKTIGREEISPREGVLDIIMPKDIDPPIKGIVQEVFAGPNGTVFRIAEGIGVLEINLTKLVKEIEPCLDKEIVEKCIHKGEVEDVVTSGFRVLEERMRAKIGANATLHGVDLINEAFNPTSGKLVFGEAQSERDGLFFLFRGSFQLFRNPVSHRFVEEYSEFEVFEIVTFINLLLNVVDKCKPRSHEKTPSPV